MCKVVHVQVILIVTKGIWSASEKSFRPSLRINALDRVVSERYHVKNWNVKIWSFFKKEISNSKVSAIQQSQHTFNFLSSNQEAEEDETNDPSGRDRNPSEGSINLER